MARGDVEASFTVKAEDADWADAALREAGFRVGMEEVRPSDDPNTHVVVTAARATGSENPDAETQRSIIENAEAALTARSIAFRLVAHGIVMGGGTPEHRWVEVVLDGEPIGVKILAANDEEVDQQLDEIASSQALPRDRLNIKPPPGWAGYGVPEG